MNILHLYSIIESPLVNIAPTSYNEFITGAYTAEHTSYLEAQQGIYDPLSFIEVTNQIHEYFDGKEKYLICQLHLKALIFKKEFGIYCSKNLIDKSKHMAKLQAC